MAKSSTAPWVAAALVATPAGAQAPTIEQLIAQRNAELEAAIRPGCRRGASEDEIVVCGTREDDGTYRLPPIAAPGSRSSERAGGEQRAALAIDSSRCTTVGRDSQCTSGLDVIGIGFAIARAVAQAVANRD